MRVLVFSDLHAHTFKHYSEMLPSGVNSRLMDSLNVLKEIKVITEQERVDAILFGGDLFHVRRIINVQSFNLVFEMMATLKIGKPLGLLVGNHDQVDRGGSIHSIHTFKSMTTVMDEIGWYRFPVKNGHGYLLVLAVPYRAERHVLVDGIKKALSKGNAPLERGPRVLLGHIGVSGALAGSNFVLTDKELLEVSDLFPEEFDQVFLGHYHEPQQLAPNVRYVGAAMQHNWGDAGQDRGCFIWDTDSRTVEFHPLSSPQFIKIGSVGLPAALTAGGLKGHFVRVVWPAGERPSDEDQIKTEMLQQGVRAVEFVEEGVQQLSQSGGVFQAGMDMENMITEFVETQDIQDLDPEYLIEVGMHWYNEVVALEG